MFYINKDWLGCSGDIGWLCVFDKDLSGTVTEICPFQKGLQYPFFAYLPNNEKGVYATGRKIIVSESYRLDIIIINYTCLFNFFIIKKTSF